MSAPSLLMVSWVWDFLRLHHRYRGGICKNTRVLFVFPDSEFLSVSLSSIRFSLRAAAAAGACLPFLYIYYILSLVSRRGSIPLRARGKINRLWEPRTRLTFVICALISVFANLLHAGNETA